MVERTRSMPTRHSTVPCSGARASIPYRPCGSVQRWRAIFADISAKLRVRIGHRSRRGNASSVMRPTSDRSSGSVNSRLSAFWVVLGLVALAASPSVALSQWLGYPTPGIPRTAGGAPDLKAPSPRTRAGKPDFSGIWFANVPAKDYCNEHDCIQEERMARLFTISCRDHSV